MPFHTSKRGPDLVQTWSEQFVPKFSTQTQDIIYKGFQQVNIRPPLPPLAAMAPPATTGPSPFTPSDQPGFVAPMVHQPVGPVGYVNPPDHPLPPTGPGGGYTGPGGVPDNSDDGTGPGNWNPPVPHDSGDGRGGWGPGGRGGYPPPGPGPCPPGEYYDWDPTSPTYLTCVPIDPTNPGDPYPDDGAPEETPPPDVVIPPTITTDDPIGSPLVECDNEYRCGGTVLDPGDFDYMKAEGDLCDGSITDGDCHYGLTSLLDNPSGTIICTGANKCSNDCGMIVMSVICCYDGWGGELANASAWDNYDFGAAVTNCSDWCAVIGDALSPCVQAG